MLTFSRLVLVMSRSILLGPSLPRSRGNISSDHMIGKCWAEIRRRCAVPSHPVHAMLSSRPGRGLRDVVFSGPRDQEVMLDGLSRQAAFFCLTRVAVWLLGAVKTVRPRYWSTHPHALFFLILIGLCVTMIHFRFTWHHGSNVIGPGVLSFKIHYL